MYQKSIVHYMTKICIDILFIVAIICCILVPFSSSWLFQYFGIVGANTIFIKAILLASGISCAYILWQ
ncbi:MAG TPA: hypothetical protein PLD67_08695, partial [Sedimentibacter sp.]|nr:hypothetical protein [Sedimentibacter sp.]HOT22641.1 hypothetical protein [Sedimentibacter sp.]